MTKLTPLDPDEQYCDGLGKCLKQAAAPQGDPRIDKLGRSNVLTDTHVRVTMAPARAESRVVALEKSVRLVEMERLGSLMQNGVVHLQIKAGFAPERHVQFTPAEVAILYDLFDRFIHELPRVDKEPGK